MTSTLRSNAMIGPSAGLARRLPPRPQIHAEVEMSAKHRQRLAPVLECLCPSVDRPWLVERERTVDKFESASVPSRVNRDLSRRDQSLVREPRPVEDERSARMCLDYIPPDTAVRPDQHGSRPDGESAIDPLGEPACQLFGVGLSLIGRSLVDLPCRINGRAVGDVNSKHIPPPGSGRQLVCEIHGRRRSATRLMAADQVRDRHHQVIVTSDSTPCGVRACRLSERKYLAGPPAASIAG
jgi:hypothetical protein